MSYTCAVGSFERKAVLGAGRWHRFSWLGCSSHGCTHSAHRPRNSHPQVGKQSPFFRSHSSCIQVTAECGSECVCDMRRGMSHSHGRSVGTEGHQCPWVCLSFPKMHCVTSDLLFVESCTWKLFVIYSILLNKGEERLAVVELTWGETPLEVTRRARLWTGPPVLMVPCIPVHVLIPYSFVHAHAHASLMLVCGTRFTDTHGSPCPWH